MQKFSKYSLHKFVQYHLKCLNNSNHMHLCTAYLAYTVVIYVSFECMGLHFACKIILLNFLLHFPKLRYYFQADVTFQISNDGACFSKCCMSLIM